MRHFFSPTFLIILFILIPAVLIADDGSGGGGSAPSPPSRFIPCGNVVGSDGIVKNPCNACHLIQFAQNILRFFVITIALPAAAILIAIGGAMMVFSPASPGQHTRGIKIIRNALLGLFFIFAAWVIIDSAMKLAGAKTISSERTGIGSTKYGPWNAIECTVPEGATRVPQPGDASSVGTFPRIQPTFQDTRDTGPLLTHDSAAQIVTQAGMKITSTGNCSDRLNRNCTSLEGIPKDAANELVKLNQEYLKTCAGCEGITIAGGTEVGHQTHGVGKSIVDISSKNARVNAFIKSQISESNPKINTWYQDKNGSNNYYFYEGDHWHVCLTSTCKPHHVTGD